MLIFFQKKYSLNQLDNNIMRTIKNINPTPVLYNRIKGLPTIIATTFNNKDIGRKKNAIEIFLFLIIRPIK